MVDNYLLDGKYRILDTLGKGGMSTVYLAENVRLGTLWAVKKLVKKEQSKIDLLAEPNILKKLKHPALPRIFDIIEDEQNIYIIVDYIDGISLGKELENKKIFSESVVLEWAKQLCAVLNYLHEFKPNPIIYRDMKPSNIILCRDGTLKLIDFGIAREYKPNSNSDTVYIGTRGYASPEQYGFGQTSPVTDIYSLGVTLFHLVTGQNPNSITGGFEPASVYNKDVSQKLEHIIYKCTRNNPLERYQSVKELIHDIESAAPENKKQQKHKMPEPCDIRIPEDYKKVAGFAGLNEAGTTTIVVALSEALAARRVNTAIVDLTGNCRLYDMFEIYLQEPHPEEHDSSCCKMEELPERQLNPVKLDKYRCLYTAKEPVRIEKNKYIDFIEKLKFQNDVILIDTDFSADPEAVKYMDNLFLVKDMNMYSLKEYSNYLEQLSKCYVNLSRVKVVINKFIHTSVNPKEIVDTITSCSYNNSKTEKFLIDKRPSYFTVPFELNNYRIAVESVKDRRFSCKEYSTEFKKSVMELSDSIYPSKGNVSLAKMLLNFFN